MTITTTPYVLYSDGVTPVRQEDKVRVLLDGIQLYLASETDPLPQEPVIHLEVFRLGWDIAENFVVDATGKVFLGPDNVTSVEEFLAWLDRPIEEAKTQKAVAKAKLRHLLTEANPQRA